MFLLTHLSKQLSYTCEPSHPANFILFTSFKTNFFNGSFASWVKDWESQQRTHSCIAAWREAVQSQVHLHLLENSPGSCHLWFLFSNPSFWIPAHQLDSALSASYYPSVPSKTGVEMRWHVNWWFGSSGLCLHEWINVITTEWGSYVRSGLWISG